MVRRRGRPEVTLRRGACARDALRVGRVHSSRHLKKAELATLRAIPVTTPARTLVDLAGKLSTSALTEAVDDVLCRRLVDVGDLASHLAGLGAGHRGSAALWQVLGPWMPSGPLPGSIAEMRLLRRLTEAGIPAPVRQHEVRSGEKLIARLDLAWPDRHVGVELQSLRWHAPPERFYADRQRLLALRSLGWEVLEVAPRMLADDKGRDACRAVSLAVARAGGRHG